MTEVRLNDGEVLDWLESTRTLNRLGDRVKGATRIYFIQGVDGGPIKIGRSDEPETRLAMLQTGNPVALRITRVITGYSRDEVLLHELFGDFRLQGEWFRPHPVLAAIADAIADESLASEPISIGEEHQSWYARRPAYKDICRLSALERGMDKSEFDLRYEHGLHERERTITFRPEPDGEGWRNTSAG
jgi:hypothetical protein